MENWPTDSRDAGAILPGLKRQGPRKVRPEPHWSNLLLDAGVFGSSRLITETHSHSDRLRWKNVGAVAKRISTSNTRCIFPPTRDKSESEAGFSFERKVLRTNAWLRNHRNIKDMEAVFLRELLEEDEAYQRAFLDYDPYVSDLLSVNFISRGHKKRSGVLAFPMGHRFEALGASVVFDEKWGTVVVPTETPVWTAGSSITQIATSGTVYKPSAVNYKNAGCLFAIRTIFDVNFVSINSKPGMTVPAKAHLVTSFSSSDIGGHRPFHVAFSPGETHESLTVSDVGDVWNFQLNGPPQRLFSATNDSSARVGAFDSPYWEVGWGSHPETWLLGSRSSLSLCDRRTSNITSTFPIHFGTLTSFDVIRNMNSTRIFLCDTERITLLDERMFTRPLVSWKHRRAHGRALCIKALTVENKQIGLLTSRKSNFISVYDPVFHENGSLTSCDSYGLEFGLTSRSLPTSMTAYIPSSRSKSSTLGTLFCLSDAGAVFRQDLSIGQSKPSGEGEIWAHELQRLASRVPLEHEEYDDLDLVEHADVSLRKDYNSIYLNGSIDNFLARGPSVMDIVDLAPSAFERANEPIDKILTLHDMIRIVSQETTAANPRALFASNRSLPLPNPVSLYKFVPQLRVQAAEVVPWSCNLARVQSRICSSLVPTPSPGDLSAFSFNTSASEEAESKILDKDKKAREEIVVDLALAMATYSSLPFQPSRPRLAPPLISRDNDEMLSVAASALTLEEAEPPHVNHIQPCPNQGLVDGKSGAEQRQSLVVRLLASEWDPDSSAADYEFHDPYGQDYDASMPAWKLSARTKEDRESLRQAKSMFSTTQAGHGTWPGKRPLQFPSARFPHPSPSAAPKPMDTQGKRSVTRLAESQPEPLVAQTIPSQPREPVFSQVSQIAGSSQVPSTQVMSGPFGGRPGTTVPRKKKPRLPGF